MPTCTLGTCATRGSRSNSRRSRSRTPLFSPNSPSTPPPPPPTAQTLPLRRVRVHVQNSPTRQSLVLVPLENLAADPSQDYFAEGVTDELTTDLARIISPRVISETSGMRYRGTPSPFRQIAQDLDVDAVIEG